MKKLQFTVNEKMMKSLAVRNVADNSADMSVGPLIPDNIRLFHNARIIHMQKKTESVMSRKCDYYENINVQTNR